MPINGSFKQTAIKMGKKTHDEETCGPCCYCGNIVFKDWVEVIEEGGSLLWKKR